MNFDKRLMLVILPLLALGGWIAAGVFEDKPQNSALLELNPIHCEPFSQACILGNSQIQTQIQLTALESGLGIEIRSETPLNSLAASFSPSGEADNPENFVPQDNGHYWVATLPIIQSPSSYWTLRLVMRKDQQVWFSELTFKGDLWK